MNKQEEQTSKSQAVKLNLHQPEKQLQEVTWNTEYPNKSLQVGIPSIISKNPKDLIPMRRDLTRDTNHIASPKLKQSFQASQRTCLPFKKREPSCIINKVYLVLKLEFILIEIFLKFLCLLVLL